MKENIVKICVLGDGSVGKSCMVARFVSGVFKKTYDPTIEDTFTKTVEIDGKVWLAYIVDTSGQEEYTILVDTCINSCEAFLVVFDVCRESTFNSVKRYIKKIHRLKPAPDYPIIVAANKSDLEPAVENFRVKDLCENYNVDFYNTSGITGDNVVNIFHELLRRAALHKRRTHQTCCSLL